MTLSRRSLVIAVLIPVALFLLIDNPLFSDPFHIDLSILWSYAAIPPLIAVLLAWERKLRLSAFVLATIEVSMIKFAITFLTAIILWIAVGEPPPRRPHDEPIPSRHRVELVPPAPTPIPASQTTTVDGTLIDGSYRSVAGALLFVSTGLEDLVFESPEEPVRLESDQNGFTLSAPVLQTYQRLEFRRVGGGLHTARLSHTGGTLANRPFLPDGRQSTIQFRDPLGWVRIDCTVHPTEPPSRLLVLHHPFWAKTDGTGHFQIADIPNGRVVEIVADQKGHSAQARVQLRNESSIEIQMILDIDGKH